MYFSAMDDRKIKLVYLTGTWRSGSTLLCNMLGQIEDFFSVGELRYIWERSMIENRPCGCGIPFRECKVWNKVMDKSLHDVGQIECHYMIHLLQHSTRARYLPWILMPWGKRWLMSYWSKHLHHLESLYSAIQSTTGCRVIIDSSKKPIYGFLLGLMPRIDFYVVHLVRNPCGVMYSAHRKKLNQDTKEPTYMPRHNAIWSALLWSMSNVAVEVLWRRLRGRYLIMHYEDFINEPQVAIQRILAMIGEKCQDLSFLKENTVEFRANHTVSGNPNRFHMGVVKLRQDEEWKMNMRRRDKIIVRILTSFLYKRYKHPLK